jgi:hypothetical protein
MLSKSKYIKGLQCEKRLWLDKHRPELKEELSDAQKALFAQGTSVGELAQELFPGGMDATPDYDRKDGIAIGLRQTKQWIDEGASVIYEAAVSPNGLYAAMDILVKEENGYRAIEVKSSTSVKPYHIDDAAVQYYALTQAGIPLVDIEIMHIDTSYVHDGDLELAKLFKRESVLESIIPMQEFIPSKIATFSNVLRNEQMPEIEIGPHCDDPFSCDFKGFCWSHIPENNVFNLTRIGKKGWALMDDGYFDLNDIPEDYPLSDKQQTQLQGSKYGKEVFLKDDVKEFLSGWDYPLYFFDFETIGPVVPLFDGTSPYQHFPFQYSLHVLKEPNGDLEHYEFLADPENGDPRQALTTNMLYDLGKSGSIVTYNMGFEKGKIKALAASFPELEKELLSLNERIVDLMIPFQKQWVYKPEMNGSASIKKVLPAMTDLSYDDLEISDGGTASDTWKTLAEGTFVGDKKKTMNDLLEYCKLDTLAMVEIWRELNKRI